MNVCYANMKDFLVNWLDPEDAGEIGLEDMRRARKNGERMAKCHQEMATLPRCAQHGTVSRSLEFEPCWDCLMDHCW